MCIQLCSIYGSFLRCYSTYESKENSTFSLSSFHFCANSSSFGNVDSASIKNNIVESNDINATNNIIAYVTLIGFDAKTYIISTFNLFINNTADALFCFWFTSESQELRASLFISNKRLALVYGVFHYNSQNGKNAHVNNCSFFDNYNPLFQYYNNQVEISNCICDKYTYDTSKSQLITKNIQITNEIEKIDNKNSCLYIKRNPLCNNIPYKRHQNSKLSFIVVFLLIS